MTWHDKKSNKYRRFTGVNCGLRPPQLGTRRWACPGGDTQYSFKLDWHWIDILQFDEQTKRNIQKTFKKFYKKLDVISNEVEEVKNIAEKTQSLVSDILYKEGIEKIDAAFKTLMDGANNLNQTLG